MSTVSKLLLAFTLHCLALGVPSTQASAAIEISRIALTGEATPGSNIVFRSFQFPSVDVSVVAFVASFEDDPGFSAGLFKGSSPATVELLVEVGDPIPFSSENFLVFCAVPSIDDGVVAFCADDTTTPFHEDGIFEVDVFGTVRTIVDESTIVPGTAGEFSGFGKPSLNGGAIAFNGVDGSSLYGMYLELDDEIFTIADGSTPVPGVSGTFLGTTLSPPSLDAGMIAFTGREDTFFPWLARSGVYIDDGISASLIVVADSTDTAPGSGDTFQGFSTPSLSNGAVAFGALAGGLPVLILGDASGLELIADTSTVIPGGTGPFIGFGDKPSHRAGQVAFRGFGGSGQEGIYIHRGY